MVSKSNGAATRQRPKASRPAKLSPADEPFQVGDIVATDNQEVGMVEHIHEPREGKADLIVRTFDQHGGGAYSNCTAVMAKDAKLLIPFEEIWEMRERCTKQNGEPAAPDEPSGSEYPDISDWNWERLQTSEECIAHAQLLESAYPAEHPINRHFRFALKLEEDDYKPQLAEMREALANFWKLPIEEQRRALNGWEPWHDVADSRDFVRSEVDTGTVHRFLVVHRCAGQIDSVQTYGVGGSTDASLYLPFGMTRIDAIKLLDQMRDYLMVNFESAIAQKYVGDQLEKELVQT